MHPLFRTSLLMTVAVVLLAGCGGGFSKVGTTLPPVTTGPGDPATTPRTRYSFNNQCFALISKASGKYVAVSGTGYAATADKLTDAEAFYMKPSALGQYLLYNRASKLLLGAAPVSTQDLASATDDAIFTVKANGDITNYPAPPQYDVAPALADLNVYRNFMDPNKLDTVFTLTANNGQRLATDSSNALTLAASADSDTQRFTLESVTPCAIFPEAHDNTEGETFKGTYQGRVLGMADVHVHMSSSTFLGGAMHGAVFHKFGITHALDDCTRTHGPMGSKDVLAAAYESDLNGHKTDGWPTFTDWPSRDSLTHHSIYWKWIERAWKAGLRIIVNDMVENETLCELQRNASGIPTHDCNEMNTAHRQIGTTYAMQDYIDAQYGGRGKGFLQIALTPADARAKIADGKVAMVIGIEVSNVLNCKLTYNPLRKLEPKDETGAGGTENTYNCSMTENNSKPNEIKTQIEDLQALGVRQFITIHEFDNAFGGNGIFNDLVLNLGNRENSGGIPSGTISGPFTTTTETPTGEFWTTYACPNEGDPGFTGYLWGNSGGTILQNLGLPIPLYAGQGGRPGGITPYYPNTNQCNARWLTPIGLYTYTQLMKHGIIFDVDHLEIAMKSQALELAEAQTPHYPFVSTHGTFGGETNDQAGHILKNGGFLYPSLGSIRGFRGDMAETRSLSGSVSNPNLFAFGFGTDTDGLSGQEAPRNNIAAGKEVKYPFHLFTDEPFASMPEFSGMTKVTFNQPEERDAAGNGRTWTQDLDGNAHYGMMSDFVEEMRQEGTPEDMRALFNSAEVYLQTWERTLAASDAINRNGFKTPPGILRSAPKPGDVYGTAPSYFYK